MKIETCPLMILSLAVYNIFYGAVCWIIAGLNGLLFGSILMVGGTIIGVLLRNCRNCETKQENPTLTN